MALRPSVYWLLALIPVAAGLDRAGAAAPLVFLVAALAIVPLAALIVLSTEQVAERTGPAVGGLLNATFGNLPELIIAVVALRAGLVEMVRASLIGTVLANVLLALGVAFLFGGRRQHVMDYNPGAARAYGSMLMLAVITLSVPAAFHRFLGASAPASGRTVDIATSLVLLSTYVCYLVYMIKTHSELFAARESAAVEAAHHAPWGASRQVEGSGGASARSLGIVTQPALAASAAASARARTGEQASDIKAFFLNDLGHRLARPTRGLTWGPNLTASRVSI